MPLCYEPHMFHGFFLLFFIMHISVIDMMSDYSIRVYRKYQDLEHKYCWTVGVVYTIKNTIKIHQQSTIQ